MIQIFITYINKTSSIYHNITIEVVYISLKKQYIQRVVLEKKMTVENAIYASGLLELCKDINLKNNKVGIYNKLVQLTDNVSDGDRIEIYRPLITDPRKLRWKRLGR